MLAAAPGKLPAVRPTLFALLALTSSLGHAQAPAPPKGEACVIDRVVDGDTTDVRLEGRVERVRLLALDTEESWPSASKPVTPFGKETSAWAKSFLTAGEPCVVEIGGERRDIYGRLLAYLWRKQGGAWVMYNLEALARGYSPYFTKYGYSREHHDELARAQARAQAEHRGLWDPANAGHLRGDYLGADGLLARWNERADALAAFAAFAPRRPDIIEVRRDFARAKSAAGKRVVIFTALRSGKDEGGRFVGRAEGSPHDRLDIVGTQPEVDALLRNLLERYRYFYGALAEERGGLRLTIDRPGDVLTAPPPP
jgi:micrococcal nuclease